MRPKYLSFAAVAGLFMAGTLIHADVANAGRGGGRGGGGHFAGGRGGGGHSGGARGGGRHISRSFHFGGHRSFTHFRRGGTKLGSFGAGRMARGSRTLTSKTFSKNHLGLAGINSGKDLSRRNVRNFATNKSLHQASFAKHNAFFNRNRRDREHDRWRDRNGHWYGYRWQGGVFWPYAFGDYFSYAFWPYDYYDTFWGYGPDAILWGAFWPYGEFTYDGSYDYGGALAYGDIYAPYRGHRRQRATAPSSEELAATCAGLAPDVTGLPIQEIEKTIDATETQREAMEDVKAAAAKASDILKQSCPSEPPLTPVTRLDAMKHRLQAIQEAEEIVRRPFLRLYGLLSDDQRQRLEKSAQSNSRRARRARAREINLDQMCTSQAGFTNVPVREIDATISLDDSQKQKLEKLEAASQDASEGLKTSCPASIPDTVQGRLDAARQRVAALIRAVDTVRPAVRDLYASLTDEQKAALSIQPTRQAAGKHG